MRKYRKEIVSIIQKYFISNNIFELIRTWVYLSITFEPNKFCRFRTEKKEMAQALLSDFRIENFLT